MHNLIFLKHFYYTAYHFILLFLFLLHPKFRRNFRCMTLWDFLCHYEFPQSLNKIILWFCKIHFFKKFCKINIYFLAIGHLNFFSFLAVLRIEQKITYYYYIICTLYNICICIFISDFFFKMHALEESTRAILKSSFEKVLVLIE